MLRMYDRTNAGFSVMVLGLCTTAVGQPTITNTTQGTTHPSLSDAVAASNQDDVIEIGQGVLVERGIILQNRELTIRGQGPELTIIDGDSIVGRIFSVRTGSNCVFEGMTLRNGIAQLNGGLGGGAIRIGGDGSATVRDCILEGNSGATDPFGAIAFVSSGSLQIDRCQFRDNDGQQASACGGIGGGDVTVMGCTFENGVGLFAPLQLGVDGIKNVVNCTFVNTLSDHHFVSLAVFGQTSVANCVFDSSASPISDPQGLTTATRCLFSGATGNNIDANPVFVNAGIGDYRLVAASPGVDAADFGAYDNAGGGAIDLTGGARFFEDPLTPDSGSGAITWLDVGAFENRGDECPADFNGDGFVNTLDVIAFLNAFSAGCP